MIQQSSSGVGQEGRPPGRTVGLGVMLRPAPSTTQTWASSQIVVARSSGSSASTGTYAAPTRSTARMATYRSEVPEGTRTPTRSPLPTPYAASRPANSSTSCISVR